MAGAEFGASVVIGAALGNTFASTLGKADYQIRALGEAMKKVEIGKRISGEMVRTRNELANLRREQRSAAGSSAELAAQVGAAEKRLRGLNEEAKEHKIKIGDAAKAHGKFSRQLERGKERAGRLERKRGRQDYRASLKGSVMPLVGAAYTIGRVVSGAMEVEKRQVYLETVINTDDGDTEAAARRAREHAAAYARKSLASEEEILDIQYNLHSAGLDEAAATAGAEVAHMVATATRGSSDQVAAVIGTTFNNLGDSIAGADPAEKISRIGDVLTQVQQKYQISDFGQLGEGMAEAAAGATNAKLPFEQAAVAIGMMNNAGTTGSSAGTALNAVLRQLPRAADELGFSVVRGSDGSLDLAASLASLRERLPPEGEVDARAQEIQRLFGDDGAKGLAPLLQGLEDYSSGLVAAAESEGAAGAAYDRIAKSSGGQWTMMVQNLQQVGTALAGALLPIIGPMSDLFATWAGGIAAFFQDSPRLGAAIAGIGAGFAAVVATAVGMKFAWSWAKGALDALKPLGTAFKWVGRAAGIAMKGIVFGIRAITAAAKANPYLVLIGALIVAAALIYKYWEPIKAFFGRLFAPLVEFARPVFAWISAKVSAVAGWIYARLRPVAAFYGRVFGAIVEFVRPVFAWIGAKIAAVVEFVRPVFAWISAKVSAVAGWIYARLRPVAAFYGRVFGAIVEFVRPVFAWIGAKIAAVVEFVRPVFAWIGAKVAAIVGWVRKALGVVGPAFLLLLTPIGLLIGAAILLYRNWEPIKAFFAGLWNGIAAGASAAFGFLGRVWEGVKSAFSGLRSVVQGAVGAVFSWLEDFSLADIGKNLLSTLGDGILAAKDAVVEKVGAVFGAVRNLLPFSDAREGPFARLTTSGAAILGTVGEGVRRAGPGPLRRPLQSALGAAVVGLGVPAAASGISALPAGAPPAPPARSAPAQIVISPGALVVNFQGAPDDPTRIVAEVERQLADLFRRAANEARLLETDDA